MHPKHATFQGQHRFIFEKAAKEHSLTLLRFPTALGSSWCEAVQEPSPTLQTRRKSTLLRKKEPETQRTLASEIDTENPSATSSPRPNCWRYISFKLLLHFRLFFTNKLDDCPSKLESGWCFSACFERFDRPQSTLGEKGERKRKEEKKGKKRWRRKCKEKEKQ